MANDDWRIRIELAEETRLLDIPVDLRDEAAELANELKDRRLAVSRDGATLFVYASSRMDAAQAPRALEAGARQRVIVSFHRDEQAEARTISVEQWLADEERWWDEPPGPDF